MRHLTFAGMPRAIFRFSVAAMLLAIAGSVGAAAQTLLEPNSPTKPRQPPATAKSLPMGREKSCSLYGAGFVYVPASDTCVKIGGSFESSVGAGRSR